MSVKPLLLTVALLGISTPLLADFPIKPYRATYNINYKGRDIGTSTTQFNLKNSHYTLDSVSKFHVFLFNHSVTEKSRGITTANGLKPESYQLMQGHRVLYEAKPTDQEDNLSQQLAMRYNLITKDAPGSLSFTTKNGNKTIHYFIADKNYPLNTRLGKIPTTEIYYQDKDNTVVKQWLDKNKDYLPLVTRIYKDNKLISTIQLTHYQMD